MKKLIIVAACIVVGLVANFSFGASGDKGNTFAPKFHIVSSSTKPAKAAGELRYSASYLYVNISTAARPHWRRITTGASF